MGGQFCPEEGGDVSARCRGAVECLNIRAKWCGGGRGFSGIRVGAASHVDRWPVRRVRWEFIWREWRHAISACRPNARDSQAAVESR